MKKKIEQILSGKFRYEEPELLFSQERLEISLKAGDAVRGELYLGTEDDEKIQGYITSSHRRFVPGAGKFSGTTVCIPYGADGSGMLPGDVCSGWLCITSSIGEYKIPFEIKAEKESFQGAAGELNDMENFRKTAKKDFRKAYHLFTGSCFSAMMDQAEEKQKALFMGLSQQPVTYQHLEEFFIALKEKEPVSISLKTVKNEFYELTESMQESFDIQRSGWGHLRLDIESVGDFLEVEHHVVTQEDFIGSTCHIEYVLHADRLKEGNQVGQIIVSSPYQKLVYEVMASRGPRVRVDVRAEEKRHRIALIKDYLEYREGRMDFNTWTGSSHFILNQLHASGCDYPDYQMYEAYIDHLEGKDTEAVEILKKYENKEFSREELELAGIYLYLCSVTGLYRDKTQAVWRIQNFHMQKADSFQLLWLLIQMDGGYKKLPSEAIFMMEEQFERGCTSPLLYMEAWQWISRDISLFHRLSPFWIQVFRFAGRRKLLTEELVMRLAYLSGYEKNFSGSLYHALEAGYEQFPSEDVLEAICKYIMKGNPRKTEYFRWFSLAVQQGLRLTRLYEYYVETMDITYQRELPKPLLMYFNYNDKTLGDSRRAFVYASVITYKEKEPLIYEGYKETMEKFARRKLAEGQMDENYAVLYQEFLFDPQNTADAELLARNLFTCRLYCDDKKIRQVIVCHSQMKKEEIYPCVKGVAYPRIYTEDAVILFQDDKQRRYASTIHYNLKKLNDDKAAVLKVLKLGTEEPGVLLHHCEKTGMNEENLEYFCKITDSPAYSDQYKDKIRKRLLDYYAENVQGDELDHYLQKMDYRKYIAVDRPKLLEVLIGRRMFRQAMALVEEYGYEGLDLGCLLKLTSRMILKADMTEDDELLALASEVYRQGKYDEVILHYLMLYRFGPIDELLSIWKSAKGFEMDTYDLEERILSLLIFSSDYRKEGETVLESYVKQSGKERIIGAYLTQVAYGIFVKEYPMTRFIRERLEYAWENRWPLNRICRLALFMELSKEKELSEKYREMIQTFLEDCAKNHMEFGFFRRLPPELLSPWQLDDKTFVECHGHPDAKVTLYYALDAGLGKAREYKSEPVRNIYQGIFVKTFTLFYGETLHYYFRIERNGEVKETAERTVTMKKVEGTPGSKYQLLNRILSARRLDKTKEVNDGVKQYLCQEQYVKEMFTIEKEQEE